MRPVLPVLIMTACALVLAVGASRTHAAPSRDEVRAAIEAGVGHLIRRQQPDGSWKDPDVAHGGDGYDVGRTALAVLALQHAQRHVDESSKVQDAIRKGLSFILQQWPEAKTYTAGLVQQVLYKADPIRYSKPISMYGWMLVMSQFVEGPQTGAFTYGLFPFPKNFDERRNYATGRNMVSGRADNSNTQFGALGLLFSEKSGFQVPKVCWMRTYKYYVGAQHQDGSWDYMSDILRQSIGADPVTAAGTHNLTFAGTASTAISHEMLYADQHDQCKCQPGSEPVEKGLEWIAKNWSAGLEPYGWYACERVGILMGYSEFGGHDWFEAGSARLVGPVSAGTVDGFGGNVPNLCFGILFLSRGLEPIIVNKLKRTGDWNLHPHDLGHATEYITDKHQWGKQWRIVTLQPTVDYLLRVPVLWISGHEKLVFTDEEKQKLKSYVERGGTILGEACCSKKEFDQSFRSLAAELWPDGELSVLPPTHPIYESQLKVYRDFHPQLLGLALRANQGRLGVLYLPNGISCQWQRGGRKAYPSFDFAYRIHLYVQQYFDRTRTAEEIARDKVPARATPAAPVEDTTPATPGPGGPGGAGPVIPPPADPGGAADEEKN